MIVWYAVLSGLFWVALLSGHAWLDVAGLGVIAWSVVLLWVLFALPTLAIEFAIFADLINYAFSRRAYLIRAYEDRRADETVDWEAARQRIRARHPWVYWYMRVSNLAFYTSPFTPLACWAILVLHRLPEKAHSPDKTRVFKFPEEAFEAEAFLIDRVTNRRAGAR